MADALRLEAVARGNPDLAALLDGFGAIGLADAWIVAGAVAQTVWNARHGFAPRHGIADIDIVYFDPDLSEAAEAGHAARLRAAFGQVAVRLDVKNQARVHQWYAAKFGRALAPYASTAAAIATYPTTATAIGLRPGAVCVPFGTGDLWAGIVRPNKVLVSEAVYAAKAARWRALWPGLTILAWD